MSPDPECAVPAWVAEPGLQFCSTVSVTAQLGLSVPYPTERVERVPEWITEPSVEGHVEPDLHWCPRTRVGVSRASTEVCCKPMRPHRSPLVTVNVRLRPLCGAISSPECRAAIRPSAGYVCEQR